MNLTGDRVETWTWQLLDENGSLVCDLPLATTKGQITLNFDATVRGGGQVEIVDDGTPVDWLHVLLRPVWRCETTEGVIETPFGVYLPVMNERVSRGAVNVWSGVLLDRSAVLDSPCAEWVELTAGTVVANQVASWLKTLSTAPLLVEPSTVKAAAGMVWEPGTPWRTIINDALRSIGYAAVFADKNGRLVCEPYTPPLHRPVSRVFEYGEASIMKPDVTRTVKEFDTPNRVVVVGRGDAENRAPVATAENTNPADPLSYLRRGRWVTRHYVEDIDTVEGLKAVAEQRLAAVSAPARSYRVTHANVPDLWLGSRVEAHLENEVLTGTVNEMRVTTTPGALVSALWDGVNERGGNG